jgi:hypothetical protein
MRMYEENFINALRTELLEMVQHHLTPVAMRYHYAEAPLETSIKWRPTVLVLGNYSSGKSALINEFLEADIQKTGQAPTDDSFTIITYDDNPETSSPPIRVVEERDGNFLLNDPEFPFESMKKHGHRFAAHFRLKKVNSPFLKTLALIDTPGMLDSITERDRGYNYQDVIGDLAQIADLILVLFDPHKAGTIREAHTSLRDTLPSRTYEDRVLFVLNRIDECASLNDLLRVYGTLCWNLSQITGRKDIPMIHLTYSPREAAASRYRAEGDTTYLQYLQNQREELKKAVLEAPRRRLDHLASYLEAHSERLCLMMEALVNFQKKRRGHLFRLLGGGIASSLLATGLLAVSLFFFGIPVPMDPMILSVVGGGLVITFFVIWQSLIQPKLIRRFFSRILDNLDELTPLITQTRMDNWQAIHDRVRNFLKMSEGRFSLKTAIQDYEQIRTVQEKGGREVREALNELASLSPDNPVPGPFLASLQTKPETPEEAPFLM